MLALLKSILMSADNNGELTIIFDLTFSLVSPSTFKKLTGSLLGIPDYPAVSELFHLG
jgi:hypothetical protein